MEFELSADQEALRDAARAVLGRFAPVERVRAVAPAPGGPAGDDPAGPAVVDFDRELWAVLVDQGWPSVEVPEEAGGLGRGMVEVAVLTEELGRAVAPAPFVGHVLALAAVGRAARDAGDEVATWAERMVAGDALGCVAWAPGGVEVRDGPSGRAFLSGRPVPSVYASVSDVAVVVTEEAVWLVPLPPDRRPDPEPAMDRTRTVSWLSLEDTPAWHLGGAAAAELLLDRAAVTAAADLLGIASRALEMSVDYAGQREQFGKPIGSFQAVKHRLADALVDVEGMRSSTYFAAWTLAEGRPGASLAASSAKAWCADAVRRVTASALQVHGGIGFTWEHDLHLYVKRAQLDAVEFGDAPFHRERIAGLLAGRDVSLDLF